MLPLVRCLDFCNSCVHPALCQDTLPLCGCVGVALAPSTSCILCRFLFLIYSLGNHVLNRQCNSLPEKTHIIGHTKTIKKKLHSCISGGDSIGIKYVITWNTFNNWVDIFNKQTKAWKVCKNISTIHKLFSISCLQTLSGPPRTNILNYYAISLVNSANRRTICCAVFSPTTQ